MMNDDTASLRDQFKAIVIEAIDRLGAEPIARLLGVSVPTVIRWKKGETYPHPTMMPRWIEDLEAALNKIDPVQPTETNLSELAEKVKKAQKRNLKPRVLTLVLTIEDMAVSAAIWEAFRTNSPILGARITTIANGDATADIDRLRDKYNDLAEKYRESTGIEVDEE